VRAGAIVATYLADHVAAGLGDTPESDRPLVATLWGSPACGRASARLADGLRIRWSERDGWQLSDPKREVTFRIVGA
jgi:hypothetical protein